MSHSKVEASRKRRVFSEEFKQDAVRLVVSENYTFAAAAASAFDVGQQVLVGTFDLFGDKSDKNHFFILSNGKKVYGDHAYIISSVNRDMAGNIISFDLINPWGTGPGYDVTLPVSDLDQVVEGLTIIH